MKMTDEQIAKALQERQPRTGDVFLIPPSLIYIETPNVRETYSEEKFQIMKESIKVNGVLDPIHVKKTKKGFAISHGFNRMRAVWELIEEGCEIVGVKSLMSTKISEEEELFRHITLNSGEPLTKFEISKILIQLQVYGWKNKDMAHKLGYSEQEISNLITFQSQASMEVKNAVKEGVMDINPAIALVRETESTQQQNEVLAKAKEKVKSENRTKIKSTDVLSKKLSFQDKMQKCIELGTNVDSDKMKMLREMYALLSDKSNTPESILEKLK